MSDRDVLDPSNLEPSLGDFGYHSIKGGLGAFPIVGSFLVEVFGLSRDSPYEKRKKKFMIALATKLEQLARESKVDVVSLKNDDGFLDIVIQTYEIAIKNSQKEKLELLQNVVLNSALKIEIEHDEKLIFLEILAKITPSHYKILKIFYDPEMILSKIVNQRYKIGMDPKLDYDLRLPEIFNDYMKYDRSFYRTIIQDLKTWNLFNSSYSNCSGMTSPEKIIRQMMANIKQWQTDFGKRFLYFVKDPTL
jgi:hypothetical protein